MKVFLLIGGLLAPLVALAQDFTVEAAVPAAEASNVALQTTVAFTFSAPLDTTARFSGEWPVEFFTISPRPDPAFL